MISNFRYLFVLKRRVSLSNSFLYQWFFYFQWFFIYYHNHHQSLTVHCWTWAYIYYYFYKYTLNLIAFNPYYASVDLFEIIFDTSKHPFGPLPLPLLTVQIHHFKYNFSSNFLVGNTIYLVHTDQFYSLQVIRPEKSENWTLQIKFPQERDAGIYECQVNTEPKMSLAFQLNVVGKSNYIVITLIPVLSVVERDDVGNLDNW